MVINSLWCDSCLFGLADQIATRASTVTGPKHKKQGCLFSFSVRIKIKPAHNSHQGFLSGQFGAYGVGTLHPGPLQISPFHLSNYQLSFKFILVREPIQPAHPKKSCFKLHGCQHLGHETTLQWKLCKLMQSSFMYHLKKKMLTGK